jgi:hypothetical protein
MGNHEKESLRFSDPRWMNLRNRPWACRSCGGSHGGIFDLACAKPEQWPGGETYSPNDAVLSETHFLSEDFCILDNEHYFVRCVLQIPLLGLEDESFGFGVWSTLSKKNFDLYVGSFSDGAMDGLGPWFGWFSNRLKDYPDTLNLKCQVHPQSGRQRPLIQLEPTEHPLAAEQREGIGYERLLAIYAANGHEIGAAS